MSTPTRQTPKVGGLEKLGFATFSTASNVVFNFKDLFYLFFLTNVMGISIAHAGIITESVLSGMLSMTPWWASGR